MVFIAVGSLTFQTNIARDSDSIWLANFHARTVESAPEAQPLASGSADGDPMCRFGYAITWNSLTAYSSTQITALRGGWYLNFGTNATPERPNGIEYAQMVSVRQLKTVNPSYTATYIIPYTYTIQPNLGTIAALAQNSALQGSLWIVGNEPERIDFPCSNGGACGQNESLPEVYADIYHVVYQTIKANDPTAQVAIGGVVEVTPLRLKYLERVLNAYRAHYGDTMPVDVWNIHTYPVREVHDPLSLSNSWGAEIPAGLTETIGIDYPLSANYSLTVFAQEIVTFRQWMLVHGQRNKPLILSEYGAQMPSRIQDENGQYFTTARARDYMYGSFDYLLTAVDTQLGYPADDNRLVQRWNWFSVDYPPEATNGSLFSYTSKTIEQLGLDWISYVNNSAKPFGPPLNFKLLSARYFFGAPDNYGLVTATVQLQVSNSGYRTVTSTIPIQLNGGVFITQTTLTGLRGCGDSQFVTLQVPNLAQGVYNAVAEVDPNHTFTESTLADNTLAFPLLVPTYQVYLPVVLR
jgi:hypothetical protein